MLLAIEICLTAIVIAIAYVVPDLGRNWFEKWEKRLSRFSRRRALTAVSIGFLALATRAALLPILPIPEPAIHDEFSHLLLADTLAHGRLANPTHPMWIHFETFHVNQKPTYASMYYPGQGLFLAAGQVIGGHPFWGVWFSTGLMCAAICWMLQAWLSSGWALLGGFLAVVRLASFSYWANTYYGGAVAAIGGALVLGALPRIKRHQRPRDALAMGLGLAILANTRPYESLFFFLPIGAALLLWMLSEKGPLLGRALSHIVAPMSLLLAVTIASMGYYFWTVTGSPFRIPYQVNIQTYHLLYFPWQNPEPPATYHHAAMREFYLGAPVLGQYRRAHLHPILLLLVKPLPIWFFYLGPVLTLPLLVALVGKVRGIRCLFLSRKTIFLLLVCSTTLVALALPIYIPPAHYSAALTCAILAIELQAMRCLRLWRSNGRPTGHLLVRLVPAVCVVLLLLRAAAPALHVPIPVTVIHTWYSQDAHNLDRAHILAQLGNTPGCHLVIVRYKLDHEILNEWVYNRADIDGSKVVWARDMDATQNEELLRYFKNRQVWLLQADETPPELAPYSPYSNLAFNRNQVHPSSRKTLTEPHSGCF
jgi:hypothetical protein